MSKTRAEEEAPARLEDHQDRTVVDANDTRAAACREIPAPAPDSAPAAGSRTGSGRLDENVQFTAYRPRRIVAGRWYPVLAFAHLAERRPDVPGSLDPVEEVRKQAKTLLADTSQNFTDVSEDSRQAIPREANMSFVLRFAGLEINPPRRSFRWLEDVHREDFRIRAPSHLSGETIRGALTVFLGSVIVAEVSLTVQVTATHSAEASASPEASYAVPYRRIFASYSHRDESIVRQFARLATALGDEYVRDWTHLRSGQRWSDELAAMIREADIFQLFWSDHSMRSEFVRSEWEYALSLARPNFLRPTYWEDPLPVDLERNLPPPELKKLHFQRLPIDPPKAVPSRGRSAGGHARARSFIHLLWAGFGLFAMAAVWMGALAHRTMVPPSRPLSGTPGASVPISRAPVSEPIAAAPRIEGVVPSDPHVTIQAGHEIEFRVAMTNDNSPEDVIYSWNLDGREVSRSTQDSWKLPETTSVGPHAVEVAVAEARGTGLATSRRWSVEVVAPAAARTYVMTEQDVRAWLRAYVTAWHNRDVDALSSLGVVNTKQADTLRTALNAYKSLDVSITNEQIVLAGERARVYFDRTDTDETGKVLAIPRLGFELKKNAQGAVATNSLSTSPH